MRPRRRSAALLLALGLGLPGDARAQAPTAPAPDGGDQAPEAAVSEVVTVVAARFEQPVREVAAAVGRIERLELDRRQARDYADALRAEPGLSVTRDAGRFGAGSIRIRGIDGNRVALQVDGVPVPDGFAIGTFSNAGRESVAVEAVGALEVLRGPASAAYGSDALGGVVQLTTRDPADLIGTGDSWAAGLEAGADGRDQGLGVTALAAVEGRRWRALALGGRRDGSERDNEGEVPANPAETSRTTGLIKLVGMFDRGWLALGLDGASGRVETDVQHLVNGPGQYATTEKMLADDRSEHLRGSLTLELESASAWRAETTARIYWSESGVEQATSQWRGTDPRAPHPTLRERRYEYDTDLAGGTLAVRSRWTLGGTEHDLAWGAEVRRTRISELRDGVQVDLATGESTRMVLGEQLPVRDFPRSEATEVGAFLLDSIALGEGRWRLLPALRFDAYRTRAEPDATFAADNPGVSVVDTDDARLTPKLGVVFAATAAQSLWLQLAEGFRAPPVYDVNVGFTIPSLGYEALPNPDLRAERSRGLEVGWRWDAARGGAQVSFYENRYRDLIESRALIGRDPATGTTYFQSVNRDEARIRGVEARLRWGLTGRLEGWRLDLGGAWSEGRDLLRDQPLNSVDPPKLTLAAGYSGVGGLWTAEALWTLVDGKQGEVDSSVAGLYAPPGYGVLDLFATWTPRPGLTLRAALANALDRKYWAWPALRGVVAADPRLDFYTEPGRALVIGASLRF